MRILVADHQALVRDALRSLLTEHGHDEGLLGALRAGARGFVTRDLDAEHFCDALERAGRGESQLTPALALYVLESLTHGPRRVREGPRALTPREPDVLQAMADGTVSNRELAEAPGISENTVRYHVRNILQKLHLHSRAAADSQDTGGSGGRLPQRRLRRRPPLRRIRPPAAHRLSCLVSHPVGWGHFPTPRRVPHLHRLPHRRRTVRQGVRGRRAPERMVPLRTGLQGTPDLCQLPACELLRGSRCLARGHRTPLLRLHRSRDRLLGTPSREPPHHRRHAAGYVSAGEPGAWTGESRGCVGCRACVTACRREGGCGARRSGRRGSLAGARLPRRRDPGCGLP